MVDRVVMISVDDLANLSVLEQMLNVTIHAPNLKGLLASSTNFDSAFAVTAICNPSRTSTLTGENPFNNGVITNSHNWQQTIDMSTTLPAMLMQEGYDVHGFGKNFHSLHIPDAITSQLFDSYYAPPIESYGPEGSGPWEGTDEETGDYMVAQAAIDMIENPGVDPQFLMVGFKDPHVPYRSPDGYSDYYPLESITVPLDVYDEVPDFVKQFLDTPDNLTPEELKSEIRYYLTQISELDARIGEVLNSIDASDAANSLQTAVVLWSDHGMHMGDHESITKFTLWDQAARAPFVVRMPDGVPATITQAVSFLDIAPTILDMLGLAIPARMEGQSLMHLIDDPSLQDPDGGVALTTMHGSLSIRTGAYRYSLYEDGSEEYFDISAGDTLNEFNLAGNPAYAAALAQARIALNNEIGSWGFVDTGDGSVTHVHPDTDERTIFVNALTDISNIGTVEHVETVYSTHVNTVLGDFADNLNVYRLDQVSIATMSGNDLDNIITSFWSSDRIFGKGGDDTIVAFRGDDIVHGGDGNDTVYGGDGVDRLLGNDGNDTLNGGKDADTLLGNAGNDSLYGNNGDDRLMGDTGEDFLAGGNDNDILLGGDGEDRLIGGSGDDRLVGGNQNDFLAGQGGADRLYGSNGADILKGGAGDDFLSGGAGNDRLFGETGQDILFGGGGMDTFSLLAATGIKTIKDFNGVQDNLQISGNSTDYNITYNETADFTSIVGNGLIVRVLGIELNSSDIEFL